MAISGNGGRVLLVDKSFHLFFDSPCGYPDSGILQEEKDRQGAHGIRH